MLTRYKKKWIKPMSICMVMMKNEWEKSTIIETIKLSFEMIMLEYLLSIFKKSDISYL
jgi:hypothetical protein